MTMDLRQWRSVPAGNYHLSFEFFPPRNAQTEDSLWRAVRRLQPLQPDFVSVTYGAGGTTRSRTHQIVRQFQSEGMKAAAHLTCVGATRDEINEIAKNYRDAGIRHLVALRGDPPQGAGSYQPHPGGYAYASDLVAGLQRVAPFEISVAAYPETHPEAVSPEADLDNLKRKLDAGASRAITQFFFDPDVYFRFVERARAAGVTAPIIPGILPILSVARALEFARLNAASIPPWLLALFDRLDEDPPTRGLIAGMVASEQCRILAAGGVRDFHFYTLNQADLTRAICHSLGIVAVPEATQEADKSQGT